MNTGNAWYKSWFNTEYYHKLYRYRDEHEAHNFIANLVDYLQPKDTCHVMDLGCGRGRHARKLSEYNLRVTGIDLSVNNVKFAQDFATEKLRFLQGDMSDHLGDSLYDIVFNLFTSFGYFDTRKQSVKALKNIANSLKEGGVLVLDFMNVEKLQSGLEDEEELIQEGVKFKVRRFMREDFIIKEISIQDAEEHFMFEERVQLLNKASFASMMREAGLSIRKCFGDFNLQAYDALTSERLIIIADKL